MPDIRIPGGILTVGGPIHKISVRGKIWDFEMHSYCGPILLGKRGNGLKVEPIYVLAAISLWAQQGERKEGDLCRWDHEPEPITEHIIGRHYKIVGQHPPKRGE